MDNKIVVTENMTNLISNELNKFIGELCDSITLYKINEGLHKLFEVHYPDLCIKAEFVGDDARPKISITRKEV